MIKGLKTVYDLLKENDIFLDILYDVFEREIYKFIIDELFEHEMGIINVPGMTSCFIYEEFHPNDRGEFKIK